METLSWLYNTSNLKIENLILPSKALVISHPQRNLKIFSFCIAPNYKLLSDNGFFFSRYHKNPLKSIIHEDDRELKLHSGQYKCTNPSRHIFRSLNPVLYEFMRYNVHNPTLIDENRLGMASENTNFQVEFSKRICFFYCSSCPFVLIS